LGQCTTITRVMWCGICRKGKGIGANIRAVSRVASGFSAGARIAASFGAAAAAAVVDVVSHHVL